MVQPLSGSLSKDSNGTIVATNLAVTSVTSVQTGQVLNMTKYLDLQTAGSTGSNFFILDGAVETFHGTAPTSMTSPSNSTNLVSLATGYLFTMMISNGYVSDEMIQAIAPNSGLTGGFGWSGVLTLSISAFNSALGSSQVTSGQLILTSPTPAPAAETLNPAVVPEPSSIVLAGLGLILAVGRFRGIASRSAR